jgi:hypothetical protein
MKLMALWYGRRVYWWKIPTFLKNLMSVTSKLKVRVADSSETWLPIYITGWRHVPEYDNLHITAPRTSNLTAILIATLSLT